MFQTLVKAFKIKEVRRKILFTLLILLVYRIGCFIPVPGIGAGRPFYRSMRIILSCICRS